MSISMEQVAKLAGTSRATVSYVLRNRWHEKGITDQTRKRIISVAQKHGYRPNNLARSLVSGKTQIIGVQFPSFLYDHWSSILTQLEIESRQRGYRLLLSMPATYEDESDQIEMLLEHRVDGLILAPRRSRRLWRIYQFLEQEKKPFVFLGNSPGEHYFSVVDDNAGQAAMAVNHLIGLGHRRIAQLMGSPKSRGAIERYFGYRRALAGAGIPFCREYLRRGELTIESSHQQTTKLLELSHPPTAIYCIADVMAIGAIESIESAGLRVPEDIAVIGHADDLPFSSFHRVPLTTVRQPRRQLAEQSMKMLFEIMEGKAPATKYMQLPGELIVRQSCGMSMSGRGVAISG